MSAHLSDEQRDAVAGGASDAGLDAHLAGCPGCREGVRDAKARVAMLKHLTPWTLSDMAFRRVEARLMEQVDDGLPSPWPAWLKVVVPVAVVAGVVLAVTVGGARAPEPSPVAPLAVQRPAPKPFLPMLVTFASGDAKQRRGDDAWQTLGAAENVEAGVALSASQLVLSSARLVLELEGALATGGQAMVVLGAGTAAAAGEAEVLAGPRRVTAVDAIFRVERTAAEVVVDVASGEVTVFDEGSAQRRTLWGPARVRWADGTALDRGVTEPVVAWRAPRSPTQPVRLDLGAWPERTLVSVDDLAVGATPFSFMLEEGRHRVKLTPPGQATQERAVELFRGQPLVLALGPSPEREVEAPPPDEAALAAVMSDLRRQTPKLRACYEKWLKANPSASGQVDLVLVVTAKGKVKRAEVRGDVISAESTACLKTTAKSLVLSPLGSEQELEVPLVLTPRKR